MTVAEFFADREESRHIFDALRAVMDDFDGVEVQVTKSQIAFRRRVAFAWVWMPGKYLGGRVAPLVLTLALRRREASPRWKEVVEPAKGRFTHHLELRSVDEIDDEVRSWLLEAWNAAG